MEGPQNSSNRPRIYSGVPASGCVPQKLKAGTRGDICTPTFMAALFTTAKREKDPHHRPSTGMAQRSVACAYDGAFLSLEKEGQAATGCHGGDPRGR